MAARAAAVTPPRGEEEEDEVSEMGGGTEKKAVQRRFTTHVFRKTPTAGHGHALCWGFMDKQGEGGLMHRKNFKRRFFVLYRVPQGSVLVYYDRMSVAGDDILGFIDMRKVTGVNVAMKEVAKKEAKVLEVVTAERTYVLYPQTVNARTEAPVVPKLQFILGWPVPEPALGPEIEGPEHIGEVFDKWHEMISVQLSMEKEMTIYTCDVLADSSESLPEKIALRVTPIDIVVLDPLDRDQAHTCWSYKDVASWNCPVDNELHISVRAHGAETRASFRCPDAKKIQAAIETHIQKIIKNQQAAAAGGGGGGDGGRK